MISKLRWEFIRIAMGALLSVLLVLVVCINIINYYRTNDTIDDTLAMIGHNAGMIPDYKSEAPDYNVGGGREVRMTPETPFETRYFAAVVKTDGTIKWVNTDHIAAVTDEAAEEYVNEALATGKSSGYISIYKYSIVQNNTNSVVVFLDCSNELSSIRFLLLISSVVALFSFFAVFVIVLFLSKRSIKPTVESLERQKQFITDAGHELKTPLTIITADSELLAMDIGENEWLSDIQNQTGRMRKLVSDLVMLSRMEEERSPKVKESFCLSDAVYDTVFSFGSLAETQRKSLVMEILPDISIEGDENALRQIVSILTDNAVKYCDAGGTITASLTQNKRIVFEISNTYKDVGSLELERLCDRFYRADKSRSSQGVSGYGLGLSVARSLAQSMGSKLSARQEGLDRIVFIIEF